LSTDTELILSGLRVVRARGVLVLDHLLGLVGDGLVDLLEGFLRGEEIVFVEEGLALPL